MSEFVAVSFRSPTEADTTLARLRELQKEYLVDLEDAAIAVRGNDGKVQLKQSVNLVGLGAASSGLGAASSGITGALWGSLVGLLFLNPLAGMLLGGAVGAGSGALAGSLADYGIDDDLIRDLAAKMEPRGSALFLLVRKAQPDKVMAEFESLQGQVIRTSLSPENEARLAKALGQINQPAPV